MGFFVSDERLRRMYAGRRGDRTAVRLSRLWARVFAWGLQPKRWVTLEVPGRVTGEPTRFPLGMADLDGHWYLVSMLGEDCNWVRNVRAAGGRATLIRRRSRPVQLVEVPVGQRSRVLRRYLEKVPGGRPHIPVDPADPLDHFDAVADRYPVFEVNARSR